MGECFSIIAKNCSVGNAFCINNKLPMNKQSTKDIFTFLCFAMISSIQNKETKYSFHIKSPNLQPIFHWCIKLNLYKGYV